MHITVIKIIYSTRIIVLKVRGWEYMQEKILRVPGLFINAESIGDVVRGSSGFGSRWAEKNVILFGLRANGCDFSSGDKDAHVWPLILALGNRD